MYSNGTLSWGSLFKFVKEHHVSEQNIIRPVQGLVILNSYLDLTEHNAKYIIPSYCHLPVSCRSPFDRCGSFGSYKPQIYLFISRRWRNPLRERLNLLKCNSAMESLTLREEFRLRVFENRILRQILGPKRDENGEWRRLHNEELHSLYHSPNIVRVIKSRR